MPNKPKTPLRNIRVDDELWQAARDAASANGETVSEVVRKALAAYVTMPAPKGNERERENRTA